jgi:hypothetical protein
VCFRPVIHVERGLPKNGFFSVIYYSGEGLGKNGCKADILWRKALLQMVLIDELDVKDEDEVVSQEPGAEGEKPKVVKPGEEFMVQKKGSGVMYFPIKKMPF